MIKIEMTKKLAGVQITGGYYDFDELYDAIYYLIGEERSNIKDEDMRLHTLGFLYDLRHAWQGAREVITRVNWATSDTLECFELENVGTNNIYFSFNYDIPNLFVDILLLHNRIKELNKKKQIISMKIYIKIIIKKWQ